MHPINDNRIQHPIIETIKKPGFASELDCLKTGIDVLDIGCGNGSYWFDLFYELNFNSITGIDNKSNDEINISFGGRIAVNNYSDYKQYRQKQNTNIKQLTETEFNKIFKFHQIDLNKFLDSEIIVNSKYDVIIMSLFIYFFEKTTAIDYIK